MLRGPSRPMEEVTEDKAFRCYTAPGETFATEAEMKAHYHTELHRFNLKRKVAGLAPLTRAQFEEREARGVREAAAAAASQQRGGKLSTAERREAREARREAKLEAQARNPRSKAAQHAATSGLGEEDYLSHKLKQAPAFDLGCDLFSRHKSESLEANLAHMAREHGFYLPYLDYCTDVAGLVHYLQQKVYIGNVALASDRTFHSVEAVQAHMRAKGGCRVSLEGSEEEYGEYYDMQGLAAGSPLWEVEEVEGEEGEGGEEGEEEEEGEEGEEEEGEAEEEGEGFDSLFERAVALRVMTEADLDELTDAIASGVTSEEAVLAEWRPVIRAAARRARRASAAPAASTATYRVVYRPLELAAPEGPGYVEGMATLSLGRGEAAHRSMQRYTKQKFRPSHGSSVGSLGPTRPELAALMHQYADAGVLSTHLRRQLRAPNPTSERDRRALHTEARLFVKQGITNNTTANGMKHYKNQSLMY